MSDTDRTAFHHFLTAQLSELRAEGLYKSEYEIISPQAGEIDIQTGPNTQKTTLNFCANNYLGLADHPDVVATARQALDDFGYGMASVRFICGTQHPHIQLEKALSHFLEQEDTILYSSCFDANAGLFETLLGPEDAIISDALNHASIIDGIRLCKAKRFRYRNNDMQDLEAQLQAADQAGVRFKLIATDGVFSMDGIIANLQAICDLADQYQAMVMVDDSHAVGFLGANGKGSIEYCGVMDRVDLVTGTLGKALGGASGGYTSGKKKVIDWLRQRSRPYLFSNALAPMICATSLKILDMIQAQPEQRAKLWANASQFRQGMNEAGFQLTGADHPIIPVMLGDARIAQELATMMMGQNIYVIPFSFPVVPKGQARIRTQMSAAHSPDQIQYCIDSFIKCGRALNLIP